MAGMRGRAKCAFAYTADKVLVSTFSANLETLPGAQAHPKTAEWWATQPDAWAACRKDPESPERAMTRYVSWIKSLKGKPVFVAYPAGFDFLFVYWYLIRYVGESPFSHSALDIKSFAMAVLKTRHGHGSMQEYRNLPTVLAVIMTEQLALSSGVSCLLVV